MELGVYRSKVRLGHIGPLDGGHGIAVMQEPR